MLHPLDAHRGHQPRARHLLHADRQPNHRPPLPRFLGFLRSRLAEHNLPTFVVLVAKPTNTEQIQAISGRLWSSGYLPGEHAGVSFRHRGDPILFINNPPGVTADVRRKMLDGLKALNEMNFRRVGDPETHTRIEQYELAFRMQSSVPELTDIAKRTGFHLHSFTATTRKNPAPSPTPPCSRGAWSNAAFASCRFITTTGTPTPTSPAACPGNARTSTRPATG